jgi:trk system potassium uptake protein TrkH
MQFPTIFRVLGFLLMIFSFSKVPPIAVAAYYGDGAGSAFVFSFLITFLTGLALWLRFRKYYQQLRTRDGFLIVGLFWIVLCLYGALPLWLTSHLTISFTASVFESIAGLTTAGASIIPNVEGLPHAIRFYRQQMQFLGGMGVIVLAVAILPMLNIGGMQLYSAETTGPLKETKLTPRIAQTAKALWLIYIGLNIACVVAYSLAGMTLFDAICEAFSTVSTGGFSTHNANFAFYDSNLINSIAIVFMILGASNFGLHFLAIRDADLMAYWRNTEFRVFILILVGGMFLTIVALALANTYATLGDAIIKPFFTVTSFFTTTGLVTTDYSAWPAYIIFLFMVMALIGGCAGSTTGGIKMLRFVLLVKQSVRELYRLIHPKAVYSVKLGRQTLSENAVNSIWGFVVAYLGLLFLLTFLLAMTGLDIMTAFSCILSALSNTGALLGVPSNFTYAQLSCIGQWICSIAMLAGRLEIFSLVILVTPAFWRN